MGDCCPTDSHRASKNHHKQKGEDDLINKVTKRKKKQKRHNDAEPVHANDLSASKFVKNYKIFCTIINFDTYRIIFRSFLLDQKTKTITKINKHEKL